MKMLTLKETQAIYEAVADAPADEPIVLERDGHHDPDFNLEEWKREWAAIEAEIEANDSPPGG